MFYFQEKEVSIKIVYYESGKFRSVGGNCANFSLTALAQNISTHEHYLINT